MGHSDRKAIDTLILDIDNTLFDWVAVWYASFLPVYNEIIHVTGLPAAEVEAQIKAVHTARRTSEYTFLLEEIESLKDFRVGNDIRVRFKDALDQSRQGRDTSLKLYPTVFKSLWALKKQGVKLVAYTESMGFYSGYRLKRFGLDGVIDIMFSPADHELPAGVSLEKFRRLPDEYYELQVTEIRHTPPGELKPNPDVLRDILRSVGAVPERCAYVGDSVFKDVAMANDVGIFSIHAEYGTSQHKKEYDLLRRVTHWTDADVEREKQINASTKGVTPSAVLNDSFAEIFTFLTFERAPENRSETAEEVRIGLEVWKKTVDVQQHFNDLEMRIRNFALSIIGVLIASVGFTYQNGLTMEIHGHRFPTGVGFIVAALVLWAGFYLMDRYWYHVLLKGAVRHAGKIEGQLKDAVPGIALGTTISEESGKVKLFGIKLNSSRRLNIFYLLGALTLLLILVVLSSAGPVVAPVRTTRESSTVSAPTSSSESNSPPQNSSLPGAAPQSSTQSTPGTK